MGVERLRAIVCSVTRVTPDSDRSPAASPHEFHQAPEATAWTIVTAAAADLQGRRQIRLDDSILVFGFNRLRLLESGIGNVETIWSRR
jgi:hypothetical protein